MSTVRFSKMDFEEALEQAMLKLTPKPAGWWEPVILSGNEQSYIFRVKKTPEVFVLVNSSVNIRSGVAEDTGENSIRAWFVGENLAPLGNKVSRWTTRLPGWEERLAVILRKVHKMALNVGICRTCNKVEKVFVTKKDGPNKGRLFKKCENNCHFTWLDEMEFDEETPTCPKCGNKMQKKNGRHGEFWGCVRFPSCNGTRSIGKDAEEPAQMKMTLSLKPTVVEKEEDDLTAQAKQAIKSAPAVKPVFQDSKYQSDIYNWIETSGPHENLVVEALAGSGKTTTGIRGLERVPKGLRTAFVAYNSHIKKELSKRAPKHVKVMTYHGLGFRACADAFDITIDDVKNDKVSMLLEQVLDEKTYGHLYSTVKNLVSLVKGNLSTTSKDDLDALVEHHGIPLNGDEDVVYSAVRHVLDLSKEMTQVIDFDDMCWLPIALNLPMDQYDFLFVDEAQDTNKNQIELALRSVGPDSRIVAVGDRYQSLYGFRGADVDAIPNLIEALHATTLPLPITYRNPKSVVRMIRERFPHIPLEAPDWAIEGEINSIRRLQASHVQSGDMVLCRTNAPLVKPCFELIRQGVKATIVGRDIGKGLIGLIDKMRTGNVYDLMDKLATYRDEEVAKLIMAKKTSQAQTLEDRVDTIIAIADQCQTTYDVKSRILEIFNDEVKGVAFSSVHKAKGLEADHVFILRPDLMPHPMAQQDWELQQEENIEYVAKTRCRQVLTFVESEK